ncbi:MAG: hypothetical protein NVSMB64_33070 [Candidatus Velthaea sp.]
MAGLTIARFSAIALFSASIAMNAHSVSAQADTTETEVTIKGTKKGNDYNIALTAMSKCHALMLARIYDSAGHRIFPQDEAAGNTVDQGETYKTTTTVVNRDPFPVFVDLKEAKGGEKAAKCSVTEANEKVDYHRHGPFLETGAPAKFHGVTSASKDPNGQINKHAFENGPAKYKPN